MENMPDKFGWLSFIALIMTSKISHNAYIKKHALAAFFMISSCSVFFTSYTFRSIKKFFQIRTIILKWTGIFKILIWILTFDLLILFLNGKFTDHFSYIYCRCESPWIPCIQKPFHTSHNNHYRCMNTYMYCMCYFQDAILYILVYSSAFYTLSFEYDSYATIVSAMLLQNLSGSRPISSQ